MELQNHLSKGEDISEVETLALLRELQLSKYEAQAYMALLKNGPMRYKDLTETSHVPFGKIYRATRSLAGKGWIEILPKTRPKIFIPVDPQLPVQRNLRGLKELAEILEKKFHQIEPQLEAKTRHTQ